MRVRLLKGLRGYRARPLNNVTLELTPQHFRVELAFA